MAELKDSGARREFDTGAVRDVAEGKGRCDLLPLEVIGTYLYDEIMTDIGRFICTKNCLYLHNALSDFACKAYSGDVYTMFLEAAKQYEDGAKKYSDRNWEKGIPLHCFIDSGVRHYLKFMRGDNDEPHDRAFVWNILGALWTLENKPELDDIKGASENA